MVNVTQKNGDIYVMERQTLYDTDRKYNRIISSKLIAKIPKGTEIPVATRPKRAKGTGTEKKVFFCDQSLGDAYFYVRWSDVSIYLAYCAGIQRGRTLRVAVRFRKSCA